MFRFITTALLLASLVVAGPVDTETRKRCGTVISPEKLASAEADFSRNRVWASARKDNYKVAPLNVYFHIIQKSDSVEGGNIPDSQIEEQVAIMNKDFEGSGLSFKLANTTRTTNEKWFTTAGPEASEQTEMKEALRQGDEKDLNVYTVGFESGASKGILGYATFPSDAKSELKDDGVVVLYSTLPGGATENFNKGRTLVHEVGHWTGLYHTFQGGCTGEGDQVDDTPAEAGPASGCPRGSDTCPAEGEDPIHNYMNYSYDNCMEEFTQGQVDRLKDQMATYRSLTM
ncbi:hypothetical protein ONZ45_g521 [Pleurotus djamor]|nr:hypothetical protein ONZ45_g521 [Pleurotus djamor]